MRSLQRPGVLAWLIVSVVALGLLLVALTHDQQIITTRSSAVGDAVSFLARFGVILVLLYGSLRALKAWTLRQRGVVSSSAQIEILETSYLSSSRALYLVAVGPKVLLLGGTDQQISLLVELEAGGWRREDGRGKGENGKEKMGDGSLS